MRAMQGFLRLLALRQVTHDFHVSLSGVIVQHVDHARAAEARAIFAEVITLVHRTVVFSRQFHLSRWNPKFTIFRREEDLAGAPNDLSLVIPEYAYGSRIPPAHASFRIEGDDCVTFH